MCTGRMDLSFIFRAFLHEADGVFIGGCWPGECHYSTEGNYHAWNLVHLCRKLLEHIGVNPKRVRIEWISASEGMRFAEIMNDFVAQVRLLGPIGEGEGMNEAECRSRLEGVARLIPYIKMVKEEKLALRLEKEEDYSALYERDEIDRLFREVVSYHIDPEACRACMICLAKCPVGAITGGKRRIHVIDQEKCIKCGTCLHVCPPQFAAVKKTSGVPVPPPIPEGERALAGKRIETETARSAGMGFE